MINSQTSSGKQADQAPDWLRDEQGEVSPVSYLLALIFSLIMIFFAIDLGIRSGTRVAVEYAAYCAARAAATQVPRSDASGACWDDTEKQEVEKAAAACVVAVAPKQGLSMSAQPLFYLPGPFNPITSLVQRTLRRNDISVSFGKKCFGHNEAIDVTVTYRDRMQVPLSPLNWMRRGPLEMTAHAAAMLQTVQ
jgi:hypothetical protein